MHEIDPSPHSNRLRASLYVDCESFLPLECTFSDNAPLIDLEETFDQSLDFFSICCFILFSIYVVLKYRKCMVPI